MKRAYLLFAVNLLLTVNCLFAVERIRFLFFCLLVGGLPTFSSAQFTQLWARTSNPSGNDDYARAITIDTSGIYVAGEYSFGSSWRIEKRALATGLLIPAFGGAGFVTSTPSVDEDVAYAITADTSGIYVAGSNEWAAGDFRWRIEKRNLVTGALITTFGSPNGYVTSNPSGDEDIAYAITADTSGIYVAGSQWKAAGDYRFRVEKRNLATGALIWSQSDDISAGWDDAYAITADASGIYIAGRDYTFGFSNWQVQKRSLTTGALINAFGTFGRITCNASEVARAITIDASAIYVASGQYNGAGPDYQWRIEKRDLTTGALDVVFGGGTGFIISNPVAAADDRARAITIDASAIYVAGYDISLGNRQWRIEKRDVTTGALICVHTTNPNGSLDEALAITIDASGIYVAGYDGNGGRQWRIEKYDGVCGVLPVELLYFNAFPENKNLVRTEWSTASEINNDYFAIERSKDGTTFERIGTMLGGGNSSVTLNYVFYDHEPYIGISYYRLKQFDYNGQYTYSPIRQVYIGTFNIITIYPNPSSEYIHYTIASEDGGTVTVKVMDVLGREVINTEEVIEGGVTTKKLSTANLSSGSYLLQIVTKQQEKIQKQFVVK